MLVIQINKFLCILVATLLLGCNSAKNPVPNDVAIVTSLYNGDIVTVSYETPEGIFRGALWPSPGENYFRLWLIKGDQEHFYHISAPPEFGEYNKETTKEWTFKLLYSTDSRQVYTVNKKETNKAFQVELPKKKRNYSFYTLVNKQGVEMIIFMDISEKISDKGLFGYFIVP